ncbi:MAG: DUF4156 domain-containing protein [Bdellovibrionales bacterium]|nr:DUF4156 domain-containing protein [Bdellovibrionales bacterium]
MKIILVLLSTVVALEVLSGCSSRSVMPDQKEVTVSREAADKDCKEIGKISGTAMSTKGTQDEALADLKQTAANKGANYVVVKEYSAQGTSVTGIAYECP